MQQKTRGFSSGADLVRVRVRVRVRVKVGVRVRVRVRVSEVSFRRVRTSWPRA